jgi:hypothetical protein
MQLSCTTTFDIPKVRIRDYTLNYKEGSIGEAKISPLSCNRAKRRRFVFLIDNLLKFQNLRCTVGIGLKTTW